MVCVVKKSSGVYAEVSPEYVVYWMKSEEVEARERQDEIYKLVRVKKGADR